MNTGGEEKDKSSSGTRKSEKSIPNPNSVDHTSKHRLPNKKEDEDAKAKARGRRSRTIGTSRNGSERSERRNREEHKSKKQSQSNSCSDAISQPGAFREKSSERASARKGSHQAKKPPPSNNSGGNNSSKPGAWKDTSPSDRAAKKGAGLHHSSTSKNFPSDHGKKHERSNGSGQIDKKGFRNRGAVTPGVQTVRNDRARNKSSNRGGMEGHQNNENRVASNEEEEIEAVAIDVEKEEQVAQLQRRLQEQEDQRREQERLQQEDRDLRDAEEEDRRIVMERKAKIKRRSILCAMIILILVIAGGVGAFFALRHDSKGITTGTGDAGSVADGSSNSMTDTSQSPSTNPVNIPTAPPTELVKYDPPSKEDCQRLAEGLPLVYMVTVDITRDFEVTIDLGLSNADGDIVTLLPELDQKIEDWLVGPLIGCPTDNVQRRLMVPRTRGGTIRRLENLRYMIAGAGVTVIDSNELCDSTTSPKCGIVRIALSLMLRGDERNFNVIVLLSEFFPMDVDLRDVIGFSDAVDTFIARGIRSTSPTVSPSTIMPANNPSIAPTESPTRVEDLNPSFMPVDTLGTVEPTKAPTMGSTLSPATTPPPTVAEKSQNPTTISASPPTAPDATPLPTKSPSRLPTGIPTSVPTSIPTSLPTSAPTSGPSSAPTLGPTSGPTFGPTLGPTVAPAPSDWIIIAHMADNGPMFAGNTNFDPLASHGTFVSNPDPATPDFYRQWPTANPEFIIFKTGNGQATYTFSYPEFKELMEPNDSERFLEYTVTDGNGKETTGTASIVMRIDPAEDPWIDISGDHCSNDCANILWGENSFGRSGYTAYKNGNGGVNVYIKGQSPTTSLVAHMADNGPMFAGNTNFDPLASHGTFVSNPDPATPDFYRQWPTANPEFIVFQTGNGKATYTFSYPEFKELMEPNDSERFLQYTVTDGNGQESTGTASILMRSDPVEDPWIDISGDHCSNDCANIIWGENAFDRSGYTAYKNGNGGVNVYIMW